MLLYEKIKNKNIKTVNIVPWSQTYLDSNFFSTYEFCELGHGENSLNFSSVFGKWIKIKYQAHSKHS